MSHATLTYSSRLCPICLLHCVVNLTCCCQRWDQFFQPQWSKVECLAGRFNSSKFSQYRRDFSFQISNVANSMAPFTNSHFCHENDTNGKFVAMRATLQSQDLCAIVFIMPLLHLWRLSPMSSVSLALHLLLVIYLFKTDQMNAPSFMLRALSKTLPRFNLQLGASMPCILARIT